MDGDCCKFMKILTLSTYPLAVPRHGGQHRLSNIVAAYRSAGHEVQSVGVLGSDAYPPEEGFVEPPPRPEIARYIADPALMEDWAIGQLFAKRDEFYADLRSQIGECPDVIHVEQPWLFQFARRYVSQLSRRTVRILYGSSNVEHRLKRQIVHDFVGAEHAEKCGKYVLECESLAAKQADIVAATSIQDAMWLQQYANGEVIVAANGVSDRPISDLGVSQANTIVGHHKFALYCGSSHPPNISGFFQTFGDGVGCLAPNERLVVAGGAGPGIQGHASFRGVPGLSARFISTGEVSEECLRGLLETAHAIVLPITSGEGTNLKSSEALWTGRHIVATPLAMRGLEEFVKSEGVAVCENSEAFRSAVRRVMAEQPLNLCSAERDHRKKLLWSSTLRNLVNSLGK